MSPRAAHGRRGHRAPRRRRVTTAVAGLSTLAVAAACLAGAELAGSAHDKAASVALGGGPPGPTPTTGAPATGAPATGAPATGAPATGAPTTEAETTAPPATAPPATASPAAPTSPSAAPHILTTFSTTPTAPPATPPSSATARTAGPSASPGTRKPRSAPPSTAKPSATEPDGGTRPAGGSEAEEVVRLANVERAAAGCKALTVDADLTEAAQDHTDAMAATGNFSHTGTDGSQPQDRIEAAGYSWSRSGENTAKGQAAAAAVMDAWMHSPGHRANILDCGFTEIGVGVSTDGGPWWTQDFGTPS
ncbi:CAP domain-containing protein [Streptomyces sp. NPDC059556]|uniref:CAP domain-containing protein n=1 Tax=Streptomyces sp. NPDC059556 TaxID=3346863 RepID=UPI0036B59560